MQKMIGRLAVLWLPLLILAGCAHFERETPTPQLPTEPIEEEVELAHPPQPTPTPGATPPPAPRPTPPPAATPTPIPAPSPTPRTAPGPSTSPHTFSRIAIDQPVVALTFDDGPHPQHTVRLLDILKAENVRATFYVVGRNAERYPEIIRRMVREGHEIGNHTWSHPYLTRISREEARSELQRTRDVITKITGQPTTTMRPPYAAVNDSLRTWMYQEFGYPTILWSVDPRDWQRPGASVVASRIVNGAHNGAIILAHDIHSPTVDAMPAAIRGLKEKGYRFATVSQLMRMGGVSTEQRSPVTPGQRQEEAARMAAEP